MTKEDVFNIMGKYYGNQHFRWATEKGISEHDLRLLTEILKQINALGYDFSSIDTNAVYMCEDDRIAEILLDNYDKFEYPGFKLMFLGNIRFRSYSKFVPRLLEIYNTPDSEDILFRVSDMLCQIRAKQYIPEYLEIVNRPDYGIENYDCMIELLCKLKVKAVIPRLLELVEVNPHCFRWDLVKYAPLFKDPSLIPHISVFLDSDDGELRSLARKAIKKLESFAEKM